MVSSISFSTTHSSFKLRDKNKIRSWIGRVASLEKREIGSISYIFCSDSFLLKINKRYLHHNTLTDIITFDLAEDEKLDGEIYISIERVRSNAKNYNNPFQAELRRVIIHGVLHLCGYRDKTKAEIAEMRRKEEACLSLY